MFWKISWTYEKVWVFFQKILQLIVTLLDGMRPKSMYNCAFSPTETTWEKILQKEFSHLSLVRASIYRRTVLHQQQLNPVRLTSNLNAKTWHMNMPESSSKLSSQIKIDLQIFRSSLKLCWNQDFTYITPKKKNLLYNCILDKPIHSIDPWTSCSWFRSKRVNTVCFFDKIVSRSNDSNTLESRRVDQTTIANKVIINKHKISHLSAIWKSLGVFLFEKCSCLWLHCNPLQGQYRVRTGFSLCSISIQGKTYFQYLGFL